MCHHEEVPQDEPIRQTARKRGTLRPKSPMPFGSVKYLFWKNGLLINFKCRTTASKNLRIAAAQMLEVRLEVAVPLPSDDAASLTYCSRAERVYLTGFILTQLHIICATASRLRLCSACDQGPRQPKLGDVIFLSQQLLIDSLTANLTVGDQACKL